MSEIKSKKKAILNKIRHKYRLVLRDEDNHNIIAAISFRLISAFILIILIVVLFYSLGFFSSFLQPVRQIFRTQAEVEVEELLGLRDRLKEMETIIEAQSKYNESIQKILTTGLTEQEKSEIISRNRSANTQEVNSEDTSSESSKNTSSEKSPKSVAQMYLLPPVKGKVSAHFDAGQKHFGLDILAPKNSAIGAIADGFVTYADWSLETGNTMVVQHDNNLLSIYKHNSMLLKKTGDFVKAGEAIAIIGNTGSLSSGPHLHFELWHNGKALNPANYINFD